MVQCVHLIVTVPPPPHLPRVLLSLRPSQIDVDAEDDDGWTPLHAAIYWGNMGVAEELVINGADVNKKTHQVSSSWWYFLF